MELRFWGTRGSIPSPGPDTIKYGGNTTCLELILDDGTLVVFDAGTGIRGLGDRIIKMIFKTLASNIRFFEVVGRWEGPQLLVVLLDVDEAKLDLVGNKLRLLVEQSHFTDRDKFIKTTVSIGATVARANDSIESLVRRSQELANHSKWLGKNRVSLKISKD